MKKPVCYIYITIVFAFSAEAFSGYPRLGMEIAADKVYTTGEYYNRRSQRTT
jgi:hypothetical protein